jgi:hypothetical protein
MSNSLMRSFRKFLLATATLALLPAMSQAQESVTGQDLFDSAEFPVRERPRPDYDPMGMRVGSWLLFPSLTTEMLYDSNIFDTQNNEKSSAVLLFTPNLAMQSDFGRHALNINLGASHRRVTRDSNANTTSAFAHADARFDVRGDLSLTAGAKVETNQEALGNDNTPAAAKRGVRHMLYSGSVGVNKAFNRMALSATASATHYDYFDVDSNAGGKVDQDTRDGSQYSALAKLSYLLSPEYSAFVSVEGNIRDWSYTGAANRDSKGIEVLAGVDFSLTRLLLGSASIGYLRQDYDNAAFKTNNTWSYALDLTWMPTPLATVNVGGRRTIEEATQAGVSGKIGTSLSASVDIEARRNVLVTPSLSFTHKDYIGSNQVDKTYGAGLKVDYLLNRYFKLGAKYDFSKKESNVANQGYKKHVVGVYAKAEY